MDAKALKLPAGRIRLKKAAELLDLNGRTVRQFIYTGILTRADAPGDRGPRRAWHVYRDEIEMILLLGREACRHYRLGKGRK